MGKLYQNTTTPPCPQDESYSMTGQVTERHKKACKKQEVGVWIFEAVKHMIHMSFWVIFTKTSWGRIRLSLSLSLARSLFWTIMFSAVKERKHSIQLPNAYQHHVILSKWLHLPWPLINRSGVIFLFCINIMADSTWPPLETFASVLFGGYDATPGIIFYWWSGMIQISCACVLFQTSHSL